MATIPLTEAGGQVRTGRRVGQILLACGVLSSLVYVFTDVVGGLRYEGYSFSAHTISELGATGASSKPFVDPLFMMYGLLIIAFGAGVARESPRRTHALFLVGSLLASIGVLGLVTAPFSAVHMRGVERTFADTLHIVVISVTVLAILVAVGFGAGALGRRFRVYSLATLLVLLASGVMIGTYTSRLAAWQPTPGLGVVERINVYAYLLWVAVLSLTLLRRPPHR